ncbi:MAG: hypothetical protein ABJF11_07850 [Reichenbachiella sp.]|uniref:hypothetical protein n=1 Tax=Reichenbachiella sp. TaxID=2184521 RepID=UPI00326664AB
MSRFLHFVLILTLTACTDPNEDCCGELTEVNLDEPFSINKGETVDVKSSIISITFTDLLEDSLCPDDVECVTQGTLLIAIEVNGTEKKVSIGDNAKPTAVYKNYLIELQRLVYPTNEAEKANINSTYAVQMIISRQ